MQHDKILQAIGKELELGENKFNALKDNYIALAKFIENNHKLSNSEGSIYTQGSFAIDTAIKPMKYGEFDVDMVVEFGEEFRSGMQVNKFYDELKGVFLSSERYKEKMEEYKNVIRINYQGDYHFDIMPALPNPTKEEGHIKCVDTKISKWKDRAPKLYRNWFEEKLGMSQITMAGGYLFQLREMDVIDLEKPKPTEIKPVLTRTIQLVKRARDFYFQDEEECIPQSIVLTTMIAQLYKNEQTVKGFLFRIAEYFLELTETSKKFKVENPVKNIEEIFTEKWMNNPQYYENFYAFSLWFNYKIHNILHNDNLNHVKHHIKTTFGLNIIDKIQSSGFNLIDFSNYWKPKDKLSKDILVEGEYEDIDLIYNIRIKGTYEKKGDMRRTYTRSNKNFSIFPDANITFELERTSHINGIFDLVWKVRNMIGNFEDHPVRGELQYSISIQEPTAFRGNHYVECFVIKNQRIVGYDRIGVDILI